jgi:hypothetical protein
MAAAGAQQSFQSKVQEYINKHAVKYSENLKIDESQHTINPDPFSPEQKVLFVQLALPIAT